MSWPAPVKTALSAMNSAYSTLSSVLVAFVGKELVDPGAAVLQLLADNDIKPRNKDGALLRITVSRPVSDPTAFAVGLRYEKRDGTLTEDLFGLDRTLGIIKNEHGSLERMWPEYTATHKQQIHPPVTLDRPASPTAVNTFSFEP